MVKLISAFALTLSCIAFSQAQTKIKFGEVPLEDLKMARYDKDTTAHAVILYENGYFHSDDFTFTKFVRLKVLDNAGTSWATFLVHTPTKSEIKGVTVNLEGGTAVATKLDKDNIFKEEETDDYFVFKVFFPNVKPGSVLDLEYSFVGLPPRWNFQELIPVVYNELTLEATSAISFKRTFYGLEQIAPVASNKWVGQNIPALRIEPYMNDYSNYLTRFQFDLELINLPALGFYREYSTSWQTVSQRMLGFDDFGLVINQCPFVNDEAKLLKGSSYHLNQTIDSAYAYIQRNIKWNGDNSAYVTTEFRSDFLKSHSGNSAEVNLPLIALLRKSGLDARPLIMSTRDNGMVNRLSASLDQINYVACIVIHGDSSLVVDATMPHGIPGILPERCLNMSAWVVNQDAGDWIDPLQGNALVERNFVKIYPDSQGQMIAEISNTHDQYDYLDWAEKFEKAGSADEYGKQVSAEEQSLNVSNYKLISNTPAKLHSSETITAGLDGTTYLQDLGEEIILNPFIGLEDFGQNPFKSDSRTIPIDFVYPMTRSIIFSITLPPSYKISATPQQANVQLPDDGGHFTLLCRVTGNTINMKCDFKLNQSLFTEDKYPSLKEFFGEIARVVNQSVQAEKTTQ